MLLGYFRAGGKRFFVSGHFLYVLVAYTILLSALYVLNQIVDIRSDAINKKHLPLAEGYFPVKHAYVECLVLMGAAVVLTIRLPFVVAVLFIASFLFGVMYSMPPGKLKTRPILDFTVNAIGYGFLNFSIGWATREPLTFKTIACSLPYIFAVAAIFVNTTILDIEGDRKSNYLTTGIFLGRNKALILAVILILLCIASSIYVKDLVCLIPAAVALPLFILAASKRDDKFILLSIRIGGPMLVLGIGLIFPYFLVIFLIVFVFLRWYYKKRFGINYPWVSAAD